MMLHYTKYHRPMCTVNASASKMVCGFLHNLPSTSKLEVAAISTYEFTTIGNGDSSTAT
jgi:hypothetical protein